MSTIAQIFEPTIHHLETELSSIRTGRAHPAVVENISVEAYGTHTPIAHLAALSVPDPQTLVIQPWDTSVVAEIEKAIRQSSLGINPVVDGKIIRLPFPAMTNERRQLLEKVVREKSEATRVTIRKIREDQIKELRVLETSGQQSEDATELALKKLQADVDAVNLVVETLAKKKIEELHTM